MKTKKLLITIFCILGLVSMAQAKTVEEIANDLFAENVHPFLMKNCSECHSENAIYPVGPRHSHSDPASAFEVFKTKVENFENIVEAKIWRVGSNKHHCRDYQYNCENEDAVAEELKAILTEYEEKIIQETRSQNVASEITGIEVSPDAERVVLDFPMLNNNQDNEVIMSAHLARMGKSNYFIMEGLYLAASEGKYHIKNINIYVDGKKLIKQTGFERTDRTVIFSFDRTSFLPAKKLIGPYQPMIELNPGQKLDMKAELITEVEDFESPLCLKNKGKDSFRDFRFNTNSRRVVSLIAQLIEREMALDTYSPIGEKRLCNAIASEINIKHPRRSVIFRRGNMSQEETSLLIHNIYKWIDQAQPEQ